MKTYVHLWYYIPEFFFDREMFQSKFVIKAIKIKHTFYAR
jgi:hypothetical protein